MAATLLNSPRAIQMSVYVVRTFVKLRKLVASNSAVANRLARVPRMKFLRHAFLALSALPHVTTLQLLLSTLAIANFHKE
jgi:hypothetical protein